MAKLNRKDVKIFAENSKETLITEFRTEDSQGYTASFSRDPDVIQNENYSQGWVNDTNNLNTKIYGEDLNAVNYVLSYLLKYLYENGIAEWKSTTTYYQNSICKVDNALYLSLQDNNIGNDPTSTVSYWKLIPLENVSIEDSGSGFSIVKDVTDNVITFKTISVTGYGEITDNGDQLNIDIAGGGGGGGGDAYWGTIRGTITNQTDLMALINLKQDIFTVDSPLVLTDEQHLTINKATSSVSGYLDYNDFNTFNGKQDALTGFTHTYDSDDDEVTIEPSASNSNIGTDLAPITNINGLHLKVDTIGNQTSGVGHIDFSSSIYINNGNIKAWNLFHNYSNIQMAYNNEDDVDFDLGTSDDTSTGSYYFRINDTTKFRITSNSIIPQADILPPDNTYDLGSSTRTFAEGYIKTIKANEISPITTALTNMLTVNKFYFAHTPASGYDIVDIYASILSTGSNKAYLGRSRAFDEIYTKSISLNGTSYTSIPAAANNGSYAIKLNGSTKGTVYANGTGSNTIDLGTVVTSTSDCVKLSGSTMTGGLIIDYNNNNQLTLRRNSNDVVLFNDTTVSNAYRPKFSYKIDGTSYTTVAAKTAWNFASDRRLKKNIKSIEKGLDIVEKLNPVKFDFKDDPRDDSYESGFIAQEVKEIIPQAITEDENGFLALGMNSITPYLAGAIKELSEKVKKLEARIKELENDGRE